MWVASAANGERLSSQARTAKCIEKGRVISKPVAKALSQSRLVD